MNLSHLCPLCFVKLLKIDWFKTGHLSPLWLILFCISLSCNSRWRWRIWSLPISSHLLFNHALFIGNHIIKISINLFYRGSRGKSNFRFVVLLLNVMLCYYLAFIHDILEVFLLYSLELLMINLNGTVIQYRCIRLVISWMGISYLIGHASNWFCNFEKLPLLNRLYC